ncbi:MAG: hypothetical protein O7G31_01570, partial [Calditrichaeota bacterium]|nr:hypothetical protein [Calditrichota bacterium]
MSTNFTDFLYKNLPGLYRDKDESGELKKFLQLFGTSFEELEQSITQLNDDLFVERSRKEFIHLIGKLIGVEVDATLPARIQRDEVRAAFALYRSKGRKQPIQSYAEQQTEVPVTVVDFSQRVSQFQFIEGLNPVFAHRDQPVVEETGGSGNFYFFQDRAIVPLYDAENGRPITRQALEQNPALYLGTENGFS